MRRTFLASTIGAAALIAVALTPATAAAPSDTVYQAQVALNKQGFAAGTPDGQMGRQTTRAIQSFQYSKGMPATGQLTEDVLDKLGVAHGATAANAANAGTAPGQPAESPAKAAATAIYQAQIELNKRGFGAGTPDGQMGRQTQKAIQSFQYANGMQATGRLTDDVLDKLGVEHAPNQATANAAAATPTRAAPRRAVQCADFLHQGRPGGSDYHGPPVPGCR